jgi:aryl-alcohol dehydrogenase
MRQTISKWGRNLDRSPYGKDPPTGKTPITPDSVLLISGKGARGIVEGDSVPDIFIPRLVNLCTQGRFPLDRLVQYYSLREINQAAEDAEKGTILKPVLRTELE